MPKGKTVTNAVLGTAVTILLYVIPGLNLAAPLIGSGAAGYSQKQGLNGGLKVGLIIALLMLLPSLLMASLLNLMIGFPFMGLGTLALSIFLISHSLLMSLIGGAIGGVLAERDYETG